MKTTQKAPIPRWSVRLATLAALAAAPVLGWAQNAIQSLSSGVKDGGEVIRLEFSEPLAALPAGFVLQSPARVALDLPGVINATGRAQQEVNQGNLRSMALAQSGDRTRLVLNLKQSTRYRAEIDGKALVVTLEPVQVSSGTPATAAAGVRASAEPLHFADSRNTAAETLRDIDFRRGRDGAGRVVVDLPSNQVGVDIRQQGQNLIVEFLRSTAPEGLRRRLDVTDFGTPVQSVSTTQVGDRVRMTIEPRGSWEHSAYQSDNQFVLEVRPVKVDPQKLTAGPGFSGDKLSLNFQSIEVRALLQVIADFTNFNIVTSDTVTGNVTLRLKDVPWDQALDIIMQAKGLGVKKTGNVLWVAPKEELAAKEKAELEARAQVAALEPLRTQAFQLNYTKAEEISRALTGQQTGSGGASGASTGATTSATRLLSARGSVLYEARTNQLFVTDIPAKLEEVAQMVSRIDIPVRQVMIEARIVEAEDTFGRRGAHRRGRGHLRPFAGRQAGCQRPAGRQRRCAGLECRRGQRGGGGHLRGCRLQHRAVLDQRLRQHPVRQSAGQHLEPGRCDCRQLCAVAVRCGVQPLPEPGAVGAGGRRARQAGVEPAVQFRKANLKLEVTPQITPEGSVILDVDVNKDSVGQSTSAGFAINTKHVKTQVLVENGGTVVIGGIFQIDETESVNKVPVLGDIPYVGALFRNKTRASNKTELLVFLTPKVITDRNAPAR